MNQAPRNATARGADGESERADAAILLPPIVRAGPVLVPRVADGRRWRLTPVPEGGFHLSPNDGLVPSGQWISAATAAREFRLDEAVAADLPLADLSPTARRDRRPPGR